jgi:metallo-beta-lactamase family protein
MQLSFHGAAQCVTGSKHLISLDNGTQVLLDCGMFQGMGKLTIELNNHFGFNPAHLTAVVLSHAHIDHSGLLPRLYAEGFRGSIFCTEPTAPLVEALLEDSARIQEADAAYLNKKKSQKGEPLVEPLYTQDHVEHTIKLLQPIEYNQTFEVCSGIKCQYTDAGHILGSASVHLSIKDGEQNIQLTFSGDVGRFNDSILKSPEPFKQADYIILESTYGDSLHVDYNNTKDALHDHITKTCVQNGGHLVIPAFSLGRTQELLYALNALELEGRLPDIEYFVDSPLSIRITEIIKEYPEVYNKHAAATRQIDSDIFNFKGLKFIGTKEESMALNRYENPCVIISASGMAEAGRVKHHIKNNIGDPKNTILFVGYCNPEGLGGRLKAGEQQVKIFTEWFTVKCGIAEMRSMSAHGDYEDLIQYLMCQDFSKIKGLFLVHGEKEVQKNFADKLSKLNLQNIAIPHLHQIFNLT